MQHGDAATHVHRLPTASGPAPVTSTGHTAGSACVGSQQLGNRSGRGQVNGAMQWEALRKARWSAMRPGHLLAHTRRGHAAFVLMRRRSVRLRSGLPTHQMATRPRRHRCRGRSTSPAAGARLPGRTGHRLRSGTPWPVMLTGRMAPARPHPRCTAGDQRGARWLWRLSSQLRTFGLASPRSPQGSRPSPGGDPPVPSPEQDPERAVPGKVRLVEQAKGILMARNGCSAEEALTCCAVRPSTAMSSCMCSLNG